VDVNCPASISEDVCQRPASRGDRVRPAVLAGVIGEDGIKALLGAS
jgi:hypothetical protein